MSSAAAKVPITDVKAEALQAQVPGKVNGPAPWRAAAKRRA